MGKKILVTGGTGYIGSHTCVELINQGYEPLLIDNLSNSDIGILDKIEAITKKRVLFEEVEMCNPAAMIDFFMKHRDISAIIHFAAILLVNESVEKPLYYYQNNIQSTINLLNCMAEFNIPSLVFSSSCTVYGNPDSLPVNEDAPVKEAISPYGNTKKICEDIIKDTTKATNIHAISLRYFNPIGAHPTALIGETPHGIPAHLVPYITQTAKGIRPYLNVFGGDYNTPDGTCVRDYIHVVDIAKAHIAAIERLLQQKNEQGYEYFNIGTGIGYSVLDMIKAFSTATGISIDYQIAPRRVGDVEAVYADTSKASRLLGWKAALSLEEMLRSAWEWEKTFS